MTNLPPIPKDRNWSPETWRAGLDEAVRLCGFAIMKTWDDVVRNFGLEDYLTKGIIAHATTLLDAGIVKPVASEAEELLRKISGAYDRDPGYPYLWECPEAIAVIQSALDKARAGG